MDRNFYQSLANRSIAGEIFSPQECQEILTSSEIELLPLLNAAYEVRRNFCGKEVMIHIINNAQNGYCPEDCHYCVQAKTSKADIEEYPLKSDEEILAEAKHAYQTGAFRYCMVFAGRGPSERRTEKLAELIQKIKSQYPIEVCVSAGLLNEEKAKILKSAGLDRLNHNLNTSQEHYPHICTTHTYQDRLATLQAAKGAGLEMCSGMIVGMGEESKDVVEVARTLREMNVISIPVNFLMSIDGTQLTERKLDKELNPEYCLRVLCVYRFLNPKAELRVAAGREIHLRSMEVLALYPANSLFLQGYLNTRGASNAKTLQMIKDAGFTIKSEQNLDEILSKEKKNSHCDEHSCQSIKDRQDLRPYSCSPQ
ncbi:MAG: biotin synthase BioB [Candidatus Omnitrophica bacterium]|nr:biotin synthase BioB [Candidatus Omnitrophota bacterium]